MVRALGKLFVGLVVTLALATACGSEDDKKRNQGDEAGAGGQAGAPEVPAGGSKSDGGEPPLPSAGQPPVAMGGAGGEPVVDPMGGAGGEPTQTSCCQPLTCDDVDFECGYTNDQCGGFVQCDCPSGTQCGEGALCVACTPDPNICQGRCGEILDNCNTPTTCADDCGELNPGAVCLDTGFCCTPTTECAANVCGVVSDGCGGTVDCNNSCEGIQVCFGNGCCTPQTECDGLCGVVDDGCGGELDCTGTACEEGECQPNGTCCTPSPVACSGLNCQIVNDGCGNLVQCGEACAGDTSCLDNECKPSVCKAQGFDCGWVSNSAKDDGFEYCGDCAPGIFCSPENLCLPVCD